MVVSTDLETIAKPETTCDIGYCLVISTGDLAAGNQIRRPARRAGFTRQYAGNHRPYVAGTVCQMCPMLKIEKKCKEVLDKTEWIAIATVGTDGPHLAATWGDYIRALGIMNDDILLVPVGGYRKTEDNLKTNNRIELLCGTRQVQGNHGAGKGCRMRGTGQIQMKGERFEAVKKMFPWARAVLVITVEEVYEQL